MTDLPRSCVIDASVVIKLYLPEAESRLVNIYFQQNVTLYAPDLLVTECGNILWKQVRFKEYAPGQAVADLHDLRRLDITSIPTPSLIDKALTLAIAHSISIYDACYLALAQQLQLPLLTADTRLVSVLANQFQVLNLSTCLPPPDAISKN